MKRCFEKLTKTSLKWSQKLEKSRFGEGLGALGGDLEAKNLLKAVLADFGQFWPGSDRPKSRQIGPSWSQDGAKILEVGAKIAILRPFGSYFDHFWWSWQRSLEKWPKCKNEQHYSVLATFWGLGGSGWRLLGSILGDLRHKLGSLGRSWRQVGNFLATCWD